MQTPSTKRSKKPQGVVAPLFCTLVFFLLASTIRGNNLQVINVQPTGQNTTEGYYLVQFDISWDNSWRGYAPANNWDAAWVFVKYKVGAGAWKHATLNYVDGTAANDGHTAPAGSTITTPSDGKGVFLYRSGTGFGTNTWTGVQLRWNYGSDGVMDNDALQLCVLGIEMVYVSEGAFAAGSGGGESGAFTLTTINTADATVAPTGAGGFSGSAEGGYPTGQMAPDNTSWPNGFSAYYCMKYEISQEQYKDFLNLLTYAQQDTRTASSPDAAAGTGALSTTNANRNGIDIQTPGVASTTPAEYGCNGDGDGNYNESADGQNIACNYISWADGAAYADWSGLRPMTELEYEKSCRGTIAPVANEYAWGTINIHDAAYTLSNDGAANEGVNAATGKGNASYTTTDGAIDGPLRVGIFAASATNKTRQETGGSYWGIMELSGNLWERAVTIGNTEGRSYTGIHGDGMLAASGDADALNWPGATAAGSGFRGGSWSSTAGRLQVSDRIIATITDASRFSTDGWRGVRSAP